MDRTFNSQAFLESVADELIAGFDRASRATTPGLVGSAREHEVRKKLQQILPSKVAVTSGCVIDSYGSTSNQTDVIIYERDQCPIFSVNDDPSATYVPCEGVVAVGEIKSKLTTKELVDSVNKIARIKSLQRHVTDATSFRTYGSSLAMQGAHSESFDQINKPYDQIFGFILCHEFGLLETTLVEKYREACAAHAPHLSPNALISLKSGMVMFCKDGRLVENRQTASNMCVLRNPDGEFQFLLHKLATFSNSGRTAEKLPYERYLLKSHNTASSPATFYELA